MLTLLGTWRWNGKTSRQHTQITKHSETKRQNIVKSGKSGHVSPAIVEKFLAGMHYPAKKEKIVDNARSKDAPKDVMNLINKFSDKTYNSPIDVAKEIGKIG